MSEREWTVLTGEEWVAHLKAAADVAEKLVAGFASPGGKPGRDVLALLIAAKAICWAFPTLPPFDWYAARVAELDGPPRGSVRGAPQA
jgi:hypothetical protein